MADDELLNEMKRLHRRMDVLDRQVRMLAAKINSMSVKVETWDRRQGIIFDLIEAQIPDIDWSDLDWIKGPKDG